MSDHDLEREFFEKHQDAHWLVFDTRDRRCLGAVYFAPGWESRDEVVFERLRHFFALVKEVEFERQQRHENS